MKCYNVSNPNLDSCSRAKRHMYSLLFFFPLNFLSPLTTAYYYTLSFCFHFPLFCVILRPFCSHQGKTTHLRQFKSNWDWSGLFIRDIVSQQSVNCIRKISVSNTVDKLQYQTPAQCWHSNTVPSTPIYSWVPEVVLAHKTMCPQHPQMRGWCNTLSPQGMALPQVPLMLWGSLRCSEQPVPCDGDPLPVAGYSELGVPVSHPGGSGYDKICSFVVSLATVVLLRFS